ncbi:FabD/lysophospholipase-like protein [Serendipita vermifera]|nr:FabD/lysophospholipase-like protein [Serendipita vermifera]
MLEKSTKCLRLLSLDAGGGARSFSQLEILKNVMHRVQYELYPNDPDKVVLPCDYFDMIGGTDTGGLLALMFVSLHMSVDEVMEEFARLCEQVYNGKSLGTTARSNNLRSYLTDMMERREFAVDLKLAQSQRDRRSKGDDLQAKVKFRTYRHKSASSLDITVIDAMMATCASRSYFDPVTTGTSFR